jgi:hypothetical protein
VQQQIVHPALAHPEQSARQLACRFVDQKAILSQKPAFFGS